MFVNIIKAYRDVIAVCDADLIGKRFEEPSGAAGVGKKVVRQLDVKKNFYEGMEMSEEEAIEIMVKFSREDATFNIVGEKAVEAALKAGIISNDSVGRIKGIPFALVLL